MNISPDSSPAPDSSNSDQSVPPFPVGERALVLGGGGSTGNAWLIGVVAGLFDAGLDVTAADLTVGTSAGRSEERRVGKECPV